MPAPGYLCQFRFGFSDTYYIYQNPTNEVDLRNAPCVNQNDEIFRVQWRVAHENDNVGTSFQQLTADPRGTITYLGQN